MATEVCPTATPSWNERMACSPYVRLLEKLTIRINCFLRVINRRGGAVCPLAIIRLKVLRRCVGRGKP
eukprot:6189089-Pleurochrysis_carterae.AAC.6